MPSHEREGSRDRELVVRHHQHSHSESGRSSVPMWDSSDPDRAPPPLPLNPGGSPTTRTNVSPNIQAVAAGLTEKMRENAPSSYTTNPMPLKPASPEKSLIKGQYHKRMQSFAQQNGDPRAEFRSYLENRSPERPSRASVFDSADKALEKTPSRPGSSNRDSENETPSFRISNRFLTKPILGENTPPSATMLALQNMKLPGENEPTPSSGPNPAGSNSSNSNTSGLPNQTFDALSSQILSLTSIATSLQREMAQLSRRSKDNATDLVSLKAATNARDEDIRKSLRDLANNISSKLLDPEAAGRSAPPTHICPGYMIDNRAYDSSPSSRKSYTLPRIPTPNSFAAAMERELCGSPTPISDGSASIALLEKVLREMATKEGQEKLLELVDEIKSRPTKNEADKDADKTITKMLEEILNLVKDESGTRALVRSRVVAGLSDNVAQGHRSRSLSPSVRPGGSGPEDRIQLHSGEGRLNVPGNDVLPGEILDLLKRLKNSVVEGGGLTNEVKALVRELRGEVLGMGRDIARKLDEAEASRTADAGQPTGPSKAEVAAIVENSLAELREHMAYMIRENRRESLSSEISRGSVDSTDVYNAVKNALSELPLPQLAASEPPSSGMEKEDILEAVREAWETYKPEIELQNFGLERDEILECLSEGLKAYQPKHEPSLTYDQMVAAVETGLKSFTPPSLNAQPSITRDEIILTIRECLENIEFPSVQPSDREPGLTRDDILAAVSEGMSGHSGLTRELLESGITRDDVLGAVTDGLAAHHAAVKDMGYSEPQITRDDIVYAVNEAFASQNTALSTDVRPSISREEILDTIADALANQPSTSKEIELNKEDLHEAVRSGLQEVAHETKFNVGEEILDRLHEILEGMKDEFKEYSAANGRDTEQVLDAMKDGLEVLRGEIESYVDRASDVTGKDEIIDTVKEGFRLLQADMERTITDTAVSAIGDRNPDTPELLDAMEKEFEHLRQTLSSLLIRNTGSSDKEEILDAIRDIADNQAGPDTSAIINPLKQEFEHLRETIAMSMVRSEPSADREDILDAIASLKDAFQTVQDETAQRRDGNESIYSSTGELLDALHDGVDAIRADLDRILNKPSENDSNEILETLREGMAGMKAEMESLRESQKEFEENNTNRGRELMLSNESSLGSDIESLKVLITQLQIKVEAMEPPAAAEPAEDALKREHLDEVLAAVREVQGSVAGASTRDLPTDETLAKKEDTDAIETLLQNTKAKIDEIVLPEPDEIAKAEQLSTVETLLKETKDAVDDFAARMEAEGSTKADIETLETLLKDIWASIEEVQNKVKPSEESSEEDTEKLLKSDLQTVEAMIFQVKSQLDDLKLPDVETLPTKAEIQELNELVAGFKEKVEIENEFTAQAFEARKVEHGGLAEKIEEAKSVVDELREELTSKLDGSDGGLYELKTLLEGLAASAETFGTVESIKELTDLINNEFERVSNDHEATKIETEERDAGILVKQDEVRAAIIVELSTKLDEKLNEVLGKYDEAQSTVHSKFSEIEDRDAANIEALTSTKAVAEDIRLVIGAMGNSVNEACERMTEDARTFFEKVDESYKKMEEMHNEVKSSQEQAKAELEKTSASTDRVQTELQEYHPQILSTIKDILSIVGQHYEHSQKSTEELKTDLSAIPTAIPPLLPALPPPVEVPAAEKYDDSHVHEKLDTLLNHISNANTSTAQMEKLDAIQQQVMAASQQMNEMFTFQTRLIEEDNERKRREADEAAAALERSVADKVRVEAEILGLHEEKDSLLSVIQALKQEKEDLTKQNHKLSKELSGLETALDIRHEEMQVMEDRAESLERRILEGVLDHARSLLIRPSTTRNMNLRRVPSSASTATKASRASMAKDNNSIVSSGVGMALKRRSAVKTRSGSAVSSSPGKERRILSLSHVTGNRGLNDRQSMLSQLPNNGISNMKRSHSVKSNAASRKASWGARSSIGNIGNKENEIFNEEDENQSGDDSDAGTERRTSYGGDRRTSYAGTNADSMMYGAGSALSADRKVSYASSTNGLIAEHEGSILPETQEHEDEKEHEGHGAHDASQEKEHLDDDHEASDSEDDAVERDGNADYADAHSTVGEEEASDEHPYGFDEKGLSELEPPPKIGDLAHHSDSGLGTDVPSGASANGD
ncbi:hypothetical protein Plec18167_004614 [Paecilomyces lecythidis]|uniref:Uncharacterized protein n=1 Tax=Paecilomyces lecythidis TaxID=3004212 RepID=A0ABR3XPI3_9EURO